MHPDGPTIRYAAEQFATLADPFRLAILLKLRESKYPIDLSEIRATVAPTISTTSIHMMLTLLVVSRFVTRERRGNEAYYELAPGVRESMGPLFDLITRQIHAHEGDANA